MSEAFDTEPQRGMRDATLAALQALGGEARIDAIRSRLLADGAGAGAGGSAIDRELLLALAQLRREGLVDGLPSARWSLAAPPVSATPTPADPGAGDRLAELRATAYADYLLTPEWQRTRAAALERAGGCCRLHEGHREHVDVYHRSLDRLGEELDEDLVVLCRSCHLLYRRAYALVRREDPVADAPEPPPAATTVRRASRRLGLAHLLIR